MADLQSDELIKSLYTATNIKQAVFLLMTSLAMHLFSHVLLYKLGTNWKQCCIFHQSKNKNPYTKIVELIS